MKRGERQHPAQPPKGRPAGKALKAVDLHPSVRKDPLIWGFCLSCCATFFWSLYVLRSSPYLPYLLCCAVVSGGGFCASIALIPLCARKLTSKNLGGYDLNKPKGSPHYRGLIPEPLGLVPAYIFLVCAITFQLLFSHDPTRLIEYNSGLLAVTFMVLLGFTDDVLDLPWRFKMLLPFFASLPLILAYQGRTTILLPKWAHSLGPLIDAYVPEWIVTMPQSGLLEIGALYYVYMALLTVFCTNAINIYAGINGLEVGQSIIMALSVVIHNVIELSNGRNALQTHVIGNYEADSHLFSLLLSVPFVLLSLALFNYNWFPSAVFVGDTYTSFAGGYFAVVAILGHFSKTLLLFFVPQIANFIISLPQLLGFVKCPRHRVPRINEFTGLLEPTPNWTLINVFLWVFRPMQEAYLSFWLIALQAVCCGFGLYARYVFFVDNE